MLQRQAEYLDRAPSAVQTDDGVLVALAIPRHRSGRHRRSTSIATESGSPTQPITDSSNLLDADGTAASRLLRHEGAGRSRDVRDRRVRRAHGDLPLDAARQAGGRLHEGRPAVHVLGANDTSVGDVDGDGQYELFVKWDPSNSKDNSQAGYTGNVYLDAYRLDGTRLWRIDLGVNIRAGAHYTQFQVYDLRRRRPRRGDDEDRRRHDRRRGPAHRQRQRRLPQQLGLRPDRPRVPHGLRRLDGRGDRHRRLRAGPRRCRSVGRHLRQPRRPVPGRDGVPRRRAPQRDLQPRVLHAGGHGRLRLRRRRT